MIEMRFETGRPQTELFLTSENSGFLMLSASGKIYRKWQGLTIGELSVFADVDWSLDHEHDANFSAGRNLRTWVRTSRTLSAVTRNWIMGCGCEVSEVWNWPAASSRLDVSWTLASAAKCTSASKEYTLRVMPLWTLCPAGHASTGGGQAELIFHPLEPQCLKVHSKLMGSELLFYGLTSKDNPPAAWLSLESPVHCETETPADSARGENHTRSTVSTHQTKLALGLSEKASISVEILHDGNAESQKSIDNKTSHDFRMSTFFACPCAENEWQTAFANARDSLNQLVLRRSDGVIGLQAGLPWFTQFWTRDMCHSFRAAFLWSGRMSDAHKLVCDLWSRTDEMIPNYTTSHAVTSNSADALPLLLLSTADLVDHCGLGDELRHLLPRILTQLRRAAQIFQRGLFIIHKAADTWMDAQKAAPGGELLACSPRADRAVEIQAFWIAALERWADILVRSHGTEDAEFFAKAARNGLQSFREHFFSSEKRRWADHLRPDGTQDLALRPNLLLAFSSLAKAGLLHKLLRNGELDAVLEDMINSDLIVPYGVRTLSPETPVRHTAPVNDLYQGESNFIFENKIHFHPFHEFGTRLGLEHPDWAYHNGTIWPWLSHSAVQLLLLTTHYEKARQLTQTLVWHAVHGASGGALPELLDGLTSHSPWSWPKGAPHQAWSEAALINIVIEEWLGISVSNFSKTLNINTNHWHEAGDFSLALVLAQTKIRLTKRHTELQIEIPEKISLNAELEVCIFDGSKGESRRYENILTGPLPLTINLTSK
jgi:glycogen debranching enzyme